MNLRTMIVILEENFPKPTRFSTLEVIKVIRTKEKLSTTELSDSAIYKHMWNLVSKKVIKVDLTRQNRKQERPTTYYSLTEAKSNKGKKNSLFNNSVGIFLQDVFNNFGTKAKERK